MADEDYEQLLKEHAQHLEERKALIDAARESARTFDQAVLAFGSAAFGASIAFIKDVAPKPQPYTLMWLGISWFCLSAGLLAVILSFLFSHKACHFDIESGANALGNPDFKWPRNPWSLSTNLCNYFCVLLLFCGLVSWTVFALQNLAATGESMPNNPQPPSQSDLEKRGYATPRTPAPPPPAAPQSTPPPPKK